MNNKIASHKCILNYSLKTAKSPCFIAHRALVKSNQIPGKISSSEDLNGRGWIHSKPIFVINIQVWIPTAVTLESHL